MLVGIVIVNYNGASFQNECIESLIKQTYHDFRIIVVDNGSTDDSMKKLKSIYDDRILEIENHENLGVAKANNIGIKRSIELGCEYTLLLNNDTICESDFLEKLVHNEGDVVCPKIYYYQTKKIWFFGGKINKFKGTVEHFYYKEEDYKIKETTEYAPTCCLLIKNKVFDKVGYFDETYFLYYDDVDFCFQLKKKGIPIYLCNDAVIYHKVSLSSGGEQSKTAIYYNNRNRFYFIKKFSVLKRIIPYLFTYWTRKIQMKKNPIIKEAYIDYKAGKMGKKDW